MSKPSVEDRRRTVAKAMEALLPELESIRKAYPPRSVGAMYARQAKEQLQRAIWWTLHRLPPITQHVCGLRGYNGMIDPPCPACQENS